MIDPHSFNQSSRRHFLGSSAMGLGGLALAWLLKQDGLLAAPSRPELERQTFDLTPKAPPAEPRARAMISLFMGGGPSHLDMFDPKPLLAKYDGKLFPRDDIKYDNAGGASKRVMASPFRFHKRGRSGIELSELVPHMGEIADEITLVRSMHLGGIRNHVAGMRALNTGQGNGAARPALGSWLTYGLGSASQDLPAFVAMPLRSNPPGSPYWSSGFLPSLYQGTVMRDREPRILNLDPPPHLQGTPQRQNLELLETLNNLHAGRHPGELDLQARIASYQLAARMQTAAADALDIQQETKATQQLYGLDDPQTKLLGEACLIARRLVERGVRFVQIHLYSWDMHENINDVLPQRCRQVDKPSAALVKDLKQRGLLDTTLVHWGGEMGRLPVIQYRGPGRKPGRDHNTDGFSLWLAGGGVKSGCVYGATDDFGHRAVENPVLHTDYLATLLHLFGLSAEELTYTRNNQQLTILDNQPARVVKEILA